jgi:anti-sigma B factor antagonist
MATANITTNVRTSSGMGIIDLTGDLNGAAEEALTDAYNRASSNSPKIVLLNFSGLEYLNSSGIGLLVTLLIRANRKNQQLWVCGLSDHYQEIFELTRLNEAITIFETEAEAIAAAQ